MAVFLVNTCKFKGCGLTFSTLQELIYHIEDTHLDLEPKNADEHEFKQTSCMPVSYIFRLFSGEYNHQVPIKPTSLNNSRKEPGIFKSKISRTLSSPAPSSICSTTPTGSEVDDENYESESEKSSIDSWSNNSIESDTNAVLKIINNSKLLQDDNEKPYICQVTNCKKRYRNSNGLKYHTKSVHTTDSIAGGIKKEPTAPKLYKCHCDKNYKTPYGLKNHAKTCNINLAHSNPIRKLSELKALTPISTINNCKISGFGINGVTTKPVVSVSIATSNIVPSKIDLVKAIDQNKTISIDINDSVFMQTDDNENKNSISVHNIKREAGTTPSISIKAPTLQQHLLSPIETKTSINTSQS